MGRGTEGRYAPLTKEAILWSQMVEILMMPVEKHRTGRQFEAFYATISISFRILIEEFLRLFPDKTCLSRQGRSIADYNLKAMSLAQMLAGLRRGKELYSVAPLLLICLLPVLFHGCATTPEGPRQIDNTCEIFRENQKWYRSARKSSERWGIPIPVMMAIIHQESRFRADARPPRGTCLWIFPSSRPSSAFGYAQAGNETWEQYRESTGNTGADRDDFDDAIDFVGWYCNLSRIKCRISKNDAYHLYLAYHEGHGGFNRKTYRKKAWLLRVARKVDRRAHKYEGQLASCEREFRRRACCFLWPF